MELVKNWVNDQAIFQPLTDLYIKKSFNVHFEEFTDDCDSIRGCTGKSISYLIRQYLLPKLEADDPQTDQVTLDWQIFQQAEIVQTAFVYNVNLKEAGTPKKEIHYNTDNSKLFDFVKIVLDTTWLCIYTKSAQCTRHGRKVLRLIHASQLGPHSVDDCNTNNGKMIRALSYSGERKKHTFQAYVMSHEK